MRDLLTSSAVSRLAGFSAYWEADFYQFLQVHTRVFTSRFCA